MSERIELYKEILELDPGSRVFFLLAQMLEKEGKVDEALEVLARGIDRHPDYLEARLYYIDLLARHSRLDSAGVQLHKFSELLKKYPAFWHTWSIMSAGENQDIATALGLLSVFFSNPELSLTQILQAGIQAYSGSQPVFSAPSPSTFAKTKSGKGHKVKDILEEYGQEEHLGEKDTYEDPASKLTHMFSQLSPQDSENDVKCKASTITRSMADLLAEQGDTQGAIQIYNQLIDKALADGKKKLHKELSQRLSHLQAHSVQVSSKVNQLSSSENDDIHKKKAEKEENMSPRMLSMLEKLAARLEKRAQA